MPILDDIKTIKKYDKRRMLETIEDFSLQCQQAWQEVKKINIPKNYKKAERIVINGMGGSGLPGHIIKDLFKEELRVPLEVMNSYSLPWYLNRHTLYLVSSYSGSTEEPLSTLKAAAWRKAKIMGITTGSRLASFLKRNKQYPGYIINHKYNYCKQPRLGAPYSLTGQIALLKKAGFLKITDGEIKEACTSMKRLNKKWGVNVKQKDNLAKQLANSFYKKIPIIVGSQFLTGNAHAISNQINENGKNMATYFAIPELNHHLLEGLANPKSLKQLFRFFFIESPEYDSRILTRYRVTQKVLTKNGFRHSKYKAKGRDRLSQVFEILTLGSYISFYLAILNRVNPSPIPYVDLFKKELSKSKK
ncbi:MAG: SIS domain-containing protein [Patescibacteria group bacterium]